MGTPILPMSLKKSLIGTITRAGGVKQVTYNHHPLYYFAEGPNPSAPNGQGVGKKWWIISPSGAVITKMPTMM